MIGAAVRRLTATRTSFTYVLPGKLRLTYSGSPKSYPAWLAGTWIGGYGIWRMWLREAGFFLATNRIPYPSMVSAAVASDIRRVFSYWESKVGDEG